MELSKRLSIGKKIYDGDLSINEVMDKYKVTRAGAQNWLYEYRRSIGESKYLDGKKCLKRTSSHKRRNTPYDQMTKDQLIHQIMKKDIEIERSKKGYAIKGGGRKRVLITSND